MMRLAPLCLGALCLCAGGRLQAQPLAFNVHEVDEAILRIDRPRIAVARDGSAAVAFDALVDGAFVDRWHVAVQRFSSSGTRVGPLHFFEPESGCGTFDSWSNDAQHHAEIAIRRDGTLVVVMQHSGHWLDGDGGSSQITIGAVDTDGRPLDLMPDLGHCEQHKLIFVGGKRQDRPRFTLLPGDEMVLVADGFFQGSYLRNVALRALGSELEELIEEVIPHDDPASRQAYHRQPDVASNGSLLLTTWEECPLVDNQGNADECDVGAQFAQVTGGGLQPLGANQSVNTGDPAGTRSVFPSAAMNASGRSVVVWVDTRTGLHGDVFGQQFDATGRPLGPNFQISTGEGEIYFRPEVALLDDGRFMAVWTDSSAAGFRARTREYDAAGTPTGPPALLAADPNRHTGQPDLTSDGSEFVYIWGDSRDGSLSLFTNRLGTVVGHAATPPSLETSLERYPNPGSGLVTIRFSLASASPVTLSVYDRLGREVARLFDGLGQPGVREVTLDARAFPAGLYLVRMAHAHGSLVQTIHLLRPR